MENQTYLKVNVMINLIIYGIPVLAGLSFATFHPVIGLIVGFITFFAIQGLVYVATVLKNYLLNG